MKNHLKRLFIFLVLPAFFLIPASSFGQTAQSQSLTPAQQAQIASILAQIQQLQAQLNAMTGTTGTGGTGGTAAFFTRTLTLGSQGEDVRQLQAFLNSSPDTRVNAPGLVGGAGAETTYFGPLTRAAVIRFQEKYANQILAPLGLTKGTGLVGASTRASLNSIIAQGSGTGGGTGGTATTTPPTTGTVGLNISASQQPAVSLAPQGASRVPFTRLALTAGSGGDVTVNGITVERTGLANDAVFSGIVLLDESGIQIGIAKTLNSNHQTVVGEPFTIRAGQTRNLTIAGNMNTNLSPYSGQVASLTVIGVNTSAPISGTLPITGTAQTINASLSLGSAIVSVSTYDPNSASNREVGTTGYKFSGVRITAGSAEDIRLWSIRWNQTGSASANDLSNIKTYVDGAAYDTMVSPDGKYFTSIFPNGIVINRGFSKDVWIQGDIIGAGAAGRSVAFDIYRETDIYLTGETYGYGIVPRANNISTGTITGSGFTSGSPFFQGSIATISAGTVTTISRSSTVPAQNIAVNVPNQPLGGFDADIKGEPISVQQMTFHIASGTGAGTTGTTAGQLLTNVTLVDSNGAVVAGPVDATSDTTAGFQQRVVFTSTVTMPIGRTTYTLRGQVPAGVPDRTTYIVSTNPSVDWSNLTGQNTGNRISLTGVGNITMNTMTVNSGTLNVSVSANPPSQTIVPGETSKILANIQFDATSSGEDLRLNAIPIRYTHSGAGNIVSGCALYGPTGTQLSSGSNTANPLSTHVSGSDIQFTLDNSITLPKGTVTTLSLRCNVSSSAPTGSTLSFGIASPVTATGLSSGITVTVDPGDVIGQVMTISTGGTIGAGQDVSAPSYHMAAAGTTETINSIRFTAGAEDINLRQIGLRLTGTAPLNSAANYSSITLWDPNGNQVGTAFFGGNASTTIATLTRDFIIPANTSRSLIIRATIAQIGPNQAGTEGALLRVDYDNTNPANTYGTGVSSGTNIVSAGAAATNSEGVRIFKSVPIISAETISNSTLFSGTPVLMRFRVAASANGSISIYKMTLNVIPTNATVTNVNVYAYTDQSYSAAAGGTNSGGALVANGINPGAGGIVEIYPGGLTGNNVPFEVPAGATRYFEVRGTVAGATTGSSVTTVLQGDPAYPALATLMGTATEVDSDPNDNFIWSPNLSGTSAVTDRDWTNAYGANALPSNGLTQSVSR